MILILIPIGILVFIAAIFFVAKLLLGRPRCPQCGSRSNIRMYSVDTGEEQISIEKDVEEKIYDYPSYARGNTMPEKVITKTVYVPGTRTYYNTTYKCKKCGYEYIVEETSEREN